MLNRASISWNCEQVSKMMDKNKLTFDNIIQRSYVWEKERKSDLIHSIIEKFPIPNFYAKRVDGKVYDFLDGKQRMDAIHGFMHDEYYLIGIEPVVLDPDADEIEMVDVNGKTYSELPETVRKRIDSYMLTIVYYEDITPEETRIMFRKLNNGKPLSVKERNIANCVDIVNVTEIGKHEFFQKAITEKAMKARKQIPMIMKMWLILHEDMNDISFASKDFNQVMMETRISEEEKTQINNILDLMSVVLDILEEGKAKAAKRKFLSETNLISLVPLFDEVVNSGDDPRLLARFIFDNFTAKKTVSVKYADACSAGSAKNSSINARHNELTKAWKKFLESNPTILEDSKDDAKENSSNESKNLVQHDSEAQEAPSEDKVVNFPMNDPESDEEVQNEYKYGMRLRGFSPMCQPMDGLLRREDDMSGDYHDIIVYNRELNSEELNQYELDLLN